MRPVYLLALGLGILGALVFFTTREPAINPDPNHTHADFAIWVEGERLDFSSDEYMSDHVDDEANLAASGHYLSRYLHLHDNIGHVAHRHKPGLTFGDFLLTLGFEGKDGCLVHGDQQLCDGDDGRWRVALNAEQAAAGGSGSLAQLLTYDFRDEDAILLSYGTGSLAVEWDDMTDDACLYSKTCPWRGDPPAENCIADPAVPCRL